MGGHPDELGSGRQFASRQRRFAGWDLIFLLLCAIPVTDWF
jgi:hypothetical protein